MPDNERFIRGYLRYENSCAYVEIDEGNGRRPYPNEFTNADGKNRYVFCAETANRVEANEGKGPIFWTFEDSRQNKVPAKEWRKIIKPYYDQMLTPPCDAYGLAGRRDAILNAQIPEVSERAKAFPSDKSEHQKLLDLYAEAQIMWESCEASLRAIYNNVTDEKARTNIARKINSSSEKAEDYKTKWSIAIRFMLSNTSRLYQSGESMQNAGAAMQSAGKSMQKTGNAMTMWITVPIVIAILLFILFLFL